MKHYLIQRKKSEEYCYKNRENIKKLEQNNKNIRDLFSYKSTN